MTRSGPVLILLLAACAPKPTTPPPSNDPVPARAGGPIAGPRAIVEEAPPPPPPADIPGGGPIQPFLERVRKAVTDPFLACLQAGPAMITTDTALVTVTIGRAGEVLDVTLNRSSGAEAYDECLLRSFRGAEMPVPDPAILGQNGTVVTPPMAFR